MVRDGAGVIDSPALHHRLRLSALRVARGRPPWVMVEDLVQEGWIGVLQAARRFRGDGGATRDGFLLRRAVGEMRDALRRSEGRGGRLTVLYGDDDARPEVSDEGAGDPARIVERRRLLADLRCACARLSEREQAVIACDHGEAAALAARWQVTQGRISQLRRAAEGKLRDALMNWR